MKKITVAVFFGALLHLGLIDCRFSQSPFYQGKTITVVQTVGAGGTGDLRRKALFPYLQKYILGNATIVFDYMPA
jgi:tripartite-type tricarboxylate transporter receptor subunit TctC